MSKGLVERSSLEAIADAIRGKNGSSDQYTPAQMAPAISAITTGDSIDHEDLPAYVKAEALAVAERVKAKLKSDSIVFLAGSDAHQATAAEVPTTGADITAGNLHAGMAMKALSYVLPMDFAAFLGDYTWGANDTTIENGLGHIQTVTEDINEAFRGLPQFRTVGNHDPLGSSKTQNGTALTPEQLYALIGSYNDDGVTVMGSRTAGYCYRDFSSKKLRVICLNTADTSGTAGSGEVITDGQLLWFAQTLYGIGSSEGWEILVLSHHPLDWNNIKPAANVLKAYEDGGTVTVSGTTVNFSGHNSAKVIANIHGHTHCFAVEKLTTMVSGTATPFNVKRIATPNMCFGRNNEYGRNGHPEWSDNIEYGEETTYNKTSGTANDTAFCVYVINPSEEKVHAICYGAGYDREIYYGETPVAVTGVTLSVSSGTLNPGGTTTLTATVAPADATNKGVLWSSSNSAVATVNNGVVTAVAVGSATITVTTQDGGFTASYALTVEAVPQGNLIGVIGYTDGKRVKTSNGAYADVTGGVVVEYIDLSQYCLPDGTLIIRVRGGNFKKLGSPYNDNAYVFYKSDKSFTAGSYLTEGSNAHGSVTITRAFADDADNTMTITITGLTAAAVSSSYSYLRFCGLGSGANLDLRINEEF